MPRGFAYLAVCLAFAGPLYADGAFTLTSPDIVEGERIDDAFIYDGFGCTGGNTSPAFAWSDAPEGTESFAFTVFDPDAPRDGGWWHWLAFDIPADVMSLEQGAGSDDGTMPAGTVQSMTDFGETGYDGSCPPQGQDHRYEFTVYALGVASLGLADAASPADVQAAIEENALGSSRITATYGR
ncbi:YbhB/YbcL family Raf kinase inhibitor-like protein [Gymnodinialimonas hymeniacidonis]|uniref:YbhB/YbcL family Raf kinase inhibitor-like protein n=1 Tax=Gymnodinialimonas hymeniacidonis TaxID=3126508 RepID=UPI0034C6D742